MAGQRFNIGATAAAQTAAMADLPHATLVLNVGAGADPVVQHRALAALREVAGVHTVTADAIAASVRVDFDASRTSVPAIVGCLAGHGLPPSRARLVDNGPSRASG